MIEIKRPERLSHLNADEREALSRVLRCAGLKVDRWLETESGSSVIRFIYFDDGVEKVAGICPEESMRPCQHNGMYMFSDKQKDIIEMLVKEAIKGID